MNVPVCSAWLPTPPVQPPSVTMKPSLFPGASPDVLSSTGGMGRVSWDIHAPATA